MVQKYNADYDTRVAPEFSGAKSRIGGEITKGIRIVMAILFILSFVSGFIVCTQWFASELGYSLF